MNEKDCKAYKGWECWKEELCRFCIHPSCKSRCFDYDLAGNRWSLTVTGRAGAKRAAKVGVGVINKGDVALKKGKGGLLSRALEGFIIKEGKFIQDGVGKIGVDVGEWILVAKPYPYGYIVSINKKLLDMAKELKKKVAFYIGQSDAYYEFNIDDIEKHIDTFTNHRGEIEMVNFSIKLGVRINDKRSHTNVQAGEPQALP